jgi:hypothetical protein
VDAVGARLRAAVADLAAAAHPFMGALGAAAAVDASFALVLEGLGGAAARAGAEVASARAAAARLGAAAEGEARRLRGGAPAAPAPENQTALAAAVAAAAAAAAAVRGLTQGLSQLAEEAEERRCSGTLKGAPLGAWAPAAAAAAAAAQPPARAPAPPPPPPRPRATPTLLPPSPRRIDALPPPRRQTTFAMDTFNHRQRVEGAAEERDARSPAAILKRLLAPHASAQVEVD